MKFTATLCALVAVAAAHYSAAPAAEESCSTSVTVTVTSPLAQNTPSAPASHAVTGPAPYPTSVVVPVPSMPAGTGYPVEGGSKPVPSVPAGTGYPSSPVMGGAKPSGTGAYSAPPSQFTGAASSLKVGGALAAGAVAALFL